MEAEVSELTGVPKGERIRSAGSPRATVPRPALGHPGGLGRARDPAGPRRLVLPVPARGASSRRAGPARGDPGGVRRWASPRAGSTTSCGPWASPSISTQRGQPDLRGARRRGRRLPGPLARGRAYPMSGSTRRTSRSARQGGWCRWRRSWRPASPERRAADPGSRAQPGQRRGQRLAGALSGARGARSPRGPPGHQRRPRGSRQGRPGAAPRIGLAALPGRTSRATPRTSSRARPGAWSPRPSGPCSSSPTRPRPATSAAGSSPCFEPRIAAVARLLADAEPDLLAHFTFPELHRSRIRFDQPPGAAQQDDQAPDGGRRDLPQPGERDPSRRG